MLSLLRTLPALTKRIALMTALVFVLLATVGEAFHYKHHERASTVTLRGQGGAAPSPKTTEVSATLPVFEAPEGLCAMCEWEKTPATAPTPLLPPTFFFLFFLFFAGFLQKPVLLVRQTVALRDSRGPPCFAAS